MFEPRADVLYADDQINGQTNIPISEIFMNKRKGFLSVLENIEPVQQIAFIKTEITSTENLLKQENPATYDSYKEGKLYDDAYIVATREKRWDFQLARYIIFLNEELAKKQMINEFNNRDIVWEESTESFNDFYKYLKKQLLIDVNYEQFVQFFKGKEQVKFALGIGEMGIILSELVKNEFISDAAVRELLDKNCILTKARGKKQANIMSYKQYAHERRRYISNTIHDENESDTKTVVAGNRERTDIARHITITTINILSALNIKI